jgi:hypothetical protein
MTCSTEATLKIKAVVEAAIYADGLQAGENLKSRNRGPRKASMGKIRQKNTFFLPPPKNLVTIGRLR